MNARLRPYALITAFALLTACGGGGGGSSSSIPAAAVPVPSAVPSAAASASLAPANASASITVVFPAGFHRARAPQSIVRTPQYVNPTAGGLLHVKVNGVEVAGSPYTVNALPNGTQVLAVPATSNASAQALSIEEHDSSDTLILASGTGSFTLATPGATANVTLVMSINAQRVAITTDNVAGSDAQALGNGLPNPTPFCTSNANLYPFAADLSNGYVLPGVQAGNVAGVPVPTLLSQVPDGGTSALGAPTGNMYPIAFDGAHHGLTAVFTVANPLTALGVTYPNGAYPGQWVGIAYVYTLCTPSTTAVTNPIAFAGTTAVNITGGAPPFTFAVTGPCSSANVSTRQWNVTGNAAGTCTVTATDNANMASAATSITVNAATLGLNCSAAACNGLANGPSAYTLNITEPGYGSGSYTLYGTGSGCFFSPATTVTASGGAATVYVTGNPNGGTCSMLVTDSNSNSKTATMNFNAAGNPVAGGTNSIDTPPGGEDQVDGGSGCPPTCSVLPYPVVQWGGYIYYPWSYTDNRNAFGVSAYDSQGNYVTNVQVSGDRYIGSITVNVGPQTITFFGQSGSATTSWASLVP